MITGIEVDYKSLVDARLSRCLGLTMGFLTSALPLEEWFDEAAADWHVLTDREYTEFWRRWREAFEGRLALGQPKIDDVEAMSRVERELPFDAVIFSAPGYHLLPSGTSIKAPTFGYRALPLARINRSLFNSWDAIVADYDLTFTCLYTHEVGSLADPLFISLK